MSVHATKFYWDNQEELEERYRKITGGEPEGRDFSDFVQSEYVKARATTGGKPLLKRRRPHKGYTCLS